MSAKPWVSRQSFLSGQSSGGDTASDPGELSRQIKQKLGGAVKALRLEGDRSRQGAGPHQLYTNIQTQGQRRPSKMFNSQEVLQEIPEVPTRARRPVGKGGAAIQKQLKIARNFQSLEQINETKNKVAEGIQAQLQAKQFDRYKYDPEAASLANDNINDKHLQQPIQDVRMLRKMKWNIHSPRFAEAQLTLGYTDEDIALKDIKQFQKEEYSDVKIVKVRYQHHLLKLKTVINEIVEQRLQIIERQKEDDRLFEESQAVVGGPEVKKRGQWIKGTESSHSRMSRNNANDSDVESVGSQRYRFKLNNKTTLPGVPGVRLNNVATSNEKLNDDHYQAMAPSKMKYAGERRMPRNNSDGKFMTARTAGARDVIGSYPFKNAASPASEGNEGGAGEAIRGVGTLVDRQQRYFSKIAIDNEKLIYNKGQLEKSEQTYKKNRANVKQKLALYAYRAREKQKQREKKQEEIKALARKKEQEWMLEHERLIQDADLRQARLNHQDAAKLEEVRRKGDLEREKLLQTIRNRELQQQQEEEVTQQMLAELERKQARSSLVQQQETRKKSQIAEQYEVRHQQGLNRAQSVQRSQEQKLITLATKDFIKFSKVIKNSEEIKNNTQEVAKWKNRVKLKKFRSQRKVEAIDHEQKLKEINDKLDEAQRHREQEARELLVHNAVKREKEKLQKLDREKLIDKQKRQLAYKKELVLQKHLSHQLKSWNQSLSQEKSAKNTKELNLLLNDQKQIVKHQVKSTIHTSKSAIGGIVFAQKSLLDASVELEAVKETNGAELLGKLPFALSRSPKTSPLKQLLLQNTSVDKSPSSSAQLLLESVEKRKQLAPLKVNTYADKFDAMPDLNKYFNMKNSIYKKAAEL